MFLSGPSRWSCLCPLEDFRRRSAGHGAWGGADACGVCDVTSTLSPEELERAFEMIAQALDRAGADKEVQLLAKLALELAHRMGDMQALAEALDVAARDLEDGAA